MTNQFHHPRQQPIFPPVVERVKATYKQWLLAERNLPKCERYGLGHKIDSVFIDLLDTLQKAAFSPIDSKIPLLGQSLSLVDSLKFFIQFCWELKLIPNNQFTSLGQEVEGIGSMVGGWYKGSKIKTSTRVEEKK